MLKINPTQISKALGVYKANRANSVEAHRNEREKKDQVILSKEAQAFQLAFKAAKESPDVRMERVEQIKARMESGQYKVAGRDIAERMVDGALFNYNKK